MYHRVAELEYDTWDIGVSPVNFEAQLQVLQKMGNVVSLDELVQDLENNTLKNGSIALTFDDGYADNYLIAKPLLEKYKIPATFFIASGNIGKASEFWWDDLEHFILFTQTLPAHLEITIGDTAINYNLGAEAELSEELRLKHKHWKATEEPPVTAREKLYYLLWENIKPLENDEQQNILTSLKNWANVPVMPRPGYYTMSERQLQELGHNSFITVGAHTVSHPALAYHKETFQQKELLTNKQYLEKQTDKPVTLLAYPYGNYNRNSLHVAEQTNFKAAFTTEERLITKRSGLYQLARFQVKNLHAEGFRKQLKKWEKSW